jgi:hypothetical protein
MGKRHRRNNAGWSRGRSLLTHVGASRTSQTGTDGHANSFGSVIDGKNTHNCRRQIARDEDCCQSFYTGRVRYKTVSVGDNLVF